MAFEHSEVLKLSPKSFYPKNLLTHNSCNKELSPNTKSHSGITLLKRATVDMKQGLFLLRYCNAKHELRPKGTT